MTTQATHTPGPWEISKNEAGELDICEAGAGNMIADLAKCKNAEANARLIAAAPDLLEALRGSVEWLRTLREENEAAVIESAPDGFSLCDAEGIIAKAEGRAE
jgi:PAS domain-containing protein